ncbi:hypothetical protein N7495_008470 [Penicillium taxi]|uniref:uncharacterized protein n=1 Tax=Penicillium taxi TaxID=168475 RepID=UPI00254571E4|nr:uncharacterized protein N7495_008470 [Penicillium taxi]KAJ5888429.1 hypothetical protein N7495_008470 [Penicillium taxi]
MPQKAYSRAWGSRLTGAEIRREERRRNRRVILGNNYESPPRPPSNAVNESRTAANYEEYEESPSDQMLALPDYDEMYDEDTAEAVAYLRMVRSEANAIPSTISSQPVFGDSKFPLGFNQDEAFIAPALNMPAVIDQIPESQSSYYEMLEHRFNLLRATLRCKPPAAVVASLDDNHPTTTPNGGYIVARKHWRRFMMTTDPQLAQLAMMDTRAVFMLIDALTRRLSEVIRTGNEHAIKSHSAWVWGILGRLDDVEVLSGSQIADIRKLAQRAQTILSKILEDEKARLRKAEDLNNADKVKSNLEDDTLSRDSDSEMPDADHDVELDAAKARLQEKIKGRHDSAGSETRCMLDMIITIIGKFFSQRDILDQREIW